MDAVSVLQTWVQKAPWKMQSILLSGLRAPDAKTEAVKQICRWMRAQSQYNADTSKGYMGKYPWMEALEEYGGTHGTLLRSLQTNSMVSNLIAHAMEELEYLPCHYVHHFADALRVVAIYHPKEHRRMFADMVHKEIAAEIFHFHPESTVEFVKRHRDKTPDRAAHIEETESANAL